MKVLSQKVRKSHEGKVRAVFEQDNVFITSPNTPFVADPLCGTRTIRLRRDFHFGEEDPLYFPQPFSSETPHLSLIPYPSNDPAHKHTIAWHIPSLKTDFIPVNALDPSNGLGRLSDPIRTSMKKAVDALVSQASALTSAVGVMRAKDCEAYKNDQYTRSYIFALKCLLARLSSLASFKETAMAFSLCQRVYLALSARLSWFRDYVVQLREPSVAPLKTVAHVVGALVGDHETCERLYLAGIPVWYTRRLDRKEGVRVDQWVELPPASDLRTLRDTGSTLTLVDASPPYPNVYNGSITANKHGRYPDMGEFLWEFCTTNVSIDKSVRDTSALNAPPATQAVSGPSCASKSSHNKRSQPYSTALSEPAAPTERSKFLSVDSPLLPPPLPAWKTASDNVERSFDPKTQPLAGIDHGYALPDPNAIVGTANKAAKARYITTVLKLRTLLHYRLRSPAFRPLKPREWRSIVGMEAHPTKAHTLVGNIRTNMADELKSCLVSGKMEATFNLENLNEVPVEWYGQRFDQHQMPPVSVVQEVLWELFEINFRYELIALDRLCYTTGASNGEREDEVLNLFGHFHSSLIPEHLAWGREGFAHENINERRVALWGLYLVMEGWSSGRYALPRPLIEGSRCLKPWEQEFVSEEEEGDKDKDIAAVEQSPSAKGKKQCIEEVEDAEDEEMEDGGEEDKEEEALPEGEGKAGTSRDVEGGQPK
ncbi:hypothetical protein V5O48_008141 [Marasmius crinis-equi]|uniref:Uncharacterized protein n=1 Tax=Marasmius crinis-equi TaxID=585013 RepID=A0ABR3FES4_9AGAR